MDRCLLNIQPNLYAAMEDHELENRDFSGLQYSGLIVGRARRGLRRGSEEMQELYKLPHRLIEKKRRDRINECISQLKELLPDHLKQTTLGHLEKAVVLELTLKYMQELHALAEQQRQRIHSLQNGANAALTAAANKEPSVAEQGDSFQVGFHACMKQTLGYLQKHERCSARDDRYSRLLQHLQSKASSLGQASSSDVKDEDVGNCVSVIQRNRSADDLDGGDGGGEGDRHPEVKRKEVGSRHANSIDADTTAVIDETAEPQRKKIKVEPGEQAPQPPQPRSAGTTPQVPPFCVPLYFFPAPSGEAASVAAAYLPMLDPSALTGKKGWYPGPVPFFCPGFSMPTSVPRQGTAADCFGPLTPMSRGDETPDDKSDGFASRSASPDSEDNSLE